LARRRSAARKATGNRADALKIATFNVNNVRKRLPNLLDWLDSVNPDIVCLQELKTPQADFPIEALQQAGYHAVWKGEKTWNGVAILSKSGEPVVTTTSLPGNPSDHQSRYIEAAIGGILIGCLYAPNGNPRPGPKFTYKLAWLDRLVKHAATLIKDDVPAILVGDYNVVPTPFDIYPSKSWANDALVQPESRAAFRRIIDQGWIDAIRSLNPDQPMYTFWHYLRNRWERDAGLRLDHLLVSPTLSERLIAAGVDGEVRGQMGASDHAPAWILLKQ
jgi:exodeoxyribonuclease III